MVGETLEVTNQRDLCHEVLVLSSGGAGEQSRTIRLTNLQVPGRISGPEVSIQRSLGECKNDGDITDGGT